MKNIPAVRDVLRDAGEKLRLELLTSGADLSRPIRVSEVNRPGLALGGYLEHFRSERIQIIGRGEHAYCIKAEAAELSRTLNQMLDHADLPCLVITRNLSAPDILHRICEEHQVPLLRTQLDTAAFVGELTAYLEDKLSPSTLIHGVLVAVYGLGVLLQGDSGIGKSECALELLKRGHILIADDVVEIRKKRGGTLVGSGPETLRHYIEVRGLGILDVKLLFGIGSVLEHSPVELAVQLELWNPGKIYDRVGLEGKTTKILDVDLPLLNIPVSPGRNLAILLEVAALNQRVRSQGRISAKELNDRLIATMHKSATHSSHV